MASVPLRSVIPWYFVAGAVLTLGVQILAAALGTGSAFAAVVVWVPLIVGSTRESRREALRRQEEGLAGPPTGLRDPVWLEPVLAVVFLALSLGIAFSMGFLTGSGPVWLRWAAVAALVLGIAALVVLRFGLRHRVIPGSRARPE